MRNSHSQENGNERTLYYSWDNHSEDVIDMLMDVSDAINRRCCLRKGTLQKLGSKPNYYRSHTVLTDMESDSE